MNLTKLFAAATVAVLCGFGPANATPAPGPAPEPTKPTDPRHFVGRWYEIARLPNMLQKDCDAPTSDWSKQSDGGFSVVQSCHIGSPNGPLKVWRAAGHILDTGLNDKIRLGFFGGFIHQDYWIIDRADDYSWCITSTPTSKFVWIMSRRPQVTTALKSTLVARAHALGYDTTRLIYDQ